MRESSVILLVVFVVLLAVYGLSFLKVVALVIGGFVLLVVLGIMFLVWNTKRRMRRAVRGFQAAAQEHLENLQKQQQGGRPHQQSSRGGGGRGDVIDVEPKRVDEDRPGSQ